MRPTRVSPTSSGLPALLLALGAASLLSPGGHAHASPEESVDVATGPEVWEASVRPRFRLRPDFEAPTDVIIGFSEVFPKEATELAIAIAPSAHVVVLLAEDTDAESGQKWFMSLPPETQRRTRLLTGYPVDSLWVRDYGPFISHAGTITRWLDTSYLLERPLDDQFPLWLGDSLEVDPIPTDSAIDGGAVIGDGQGHCVSTLDYWADDQIADGDDAQDVLHQLGCLDLLLVPALRLDATTHIDMVAQFISPERILVGQVDPEEDAQDAERMDEAAASIASWAKAGHRELEIIRVPIPVLSEGSYYTYVNLLQLEGRAVVPHYPQISRRRESAILATLESALGRPVVTVDMGELRSLGGVVHCATFNLRLPAGAPWR